MRTRLCLYKQLKKNKNEIEKFFLFNLEKKKKKFFLLLWLLLYLYFLLVDSEMNVLLSS